jgi:hypothetical protein
MSGNDGAPSWLTEEVVTSAAKNPAVQKAAVKAASNPTVQKAAINHAKKEAGWETEPVQAQPYNPPNASGHSTMVNDVENQRSPSQVSRDFDCSPEELKEIKRFHLYLRIAYMITAIIMALASVLTLQKCSVATAFICLYVFFFSLLIFCFEVGLKAIASMIASNFGFMYSFAGRVVLVVVICGMLGSLGTWGYVAMSCLIVSLFGSFYVLLQQPRFEEYLRKKHYYAEKA